MKSEIAVIAVKKKVSFKGWLKIQRSGEVAQAQDLCHGHCELMGETWSNTGHAQPVLCEGMCNELVQMKGLNE